MKSFKFGLTALILLFGVFTLGATCTLTTPCGTFTYDVNSIDVTSSNSNGQTTITVFSDGNVIDNISCQGSGAISVSCSDSNDDGGNGDPVDFDICDFFTNPWIRSLLGCD